MYYFVVIERRCLLQMSTTHTSECSTADQPIEERKQRKERVCEYVCVEVEVEVEEEVGVEGKSGES